MTKDEELWVVLLKDIRGEAAARDMVLDEIPAEKLAEYVARVKEINPFVTGLNPRENVLLAVLVVDLIQAENDNKKGHDHDLV